MEKERFGNLIGDPLFCGIVSAPDDELVIARRRKETREATPKWPDANMIRNIRVEGFKSIASQTVELGRVNCFIGANGVGKSNLLEAIGILGAAASLGAHRDVSTAGGRTNDFESPTEGRLNSLARAVAREART